MRKTATTAFRIMKARSFSARKRNRGMGINSLNSVAKRHNGEYVPVWDDQKLSAFVVMQFNN